MQRRAFVRLVGGGVVMAAGLAGSGCSDAPPAEAIAAWQGPGAEPDLRRWLLAHAILAPHSHNLQSWLVDLREPDTLVLRCDPTRLLPETDPFSRQIMMSHGTFLELLDLAARERGQRAELMLFPEGTFDAQRVDDRPVARVRLVPDAAIARDPLFEQILHRRTNRLPYDTARAIPAQAWQALAAAVQPHPAVFGHVDAGDAAAMAQHRAIANRAWAIELTTPRTIMESYRVLRVGAREIAQHRDGLSLTAPLVVALDRLGLFDRTRAPAPDSFATRGEIDRFAKAIAATPAFFWMATRGNDRATQLAAGRAYARVQLAATAHGLAMQPLSQALQEYPEQADPYAQIHRLVGAPAPDHTVQMWARIGHAEPVPPAPRRGVDAQLVRA